MRVGIVHTAGSPCRCAQAMEEGLRALGHEVVVVDAADIEVRAAGLARECDAVFDQTDTLHGRGALRAFVRLHLEAHGAPVLGSGAAACLLADDKARCKRRMEALGAPVPPGIVVEEAPARIPAALGAPLVVKSIHEQMSRGMAVAATREEAARAAESLLARMRQPVLVERFIGGRELAVSVIAGEDGEPAVLPVLEWRIGGGVVTEAHKLQPGEDRIGDALRAGLDPAVLARIERHATDAFRGLGLGGYARFDVRLAPDGTPYFLEANTKPSLERHEALALSAAWAGLDYPALLGRLLRARGPGTAAPAPSSAELALRIDVSPGDTVLDLGTGSGVLAVAAARRGASRVLATDADGAALALAGRNAEAAGVADRIEFRAGSWYAAAGEGTVFDLVVAVPPQTPGPYPFGPRYGGPDGAEHLVHVIDGAPARLRPGTGRLWLLVLSLSNPARVRARLEERFAEVRLAGESERPFADAEMEARCPGLPAYLRGLRDRGLAEFEDRPGGGVFRNLFLRASRPARPGPRGPA